MKPIHISNRQAAKAEERVDKINDRLKDPELTPEQKERLIDLGILNLTLLWDYTADRTIQLH